MSVKKISEVWELALPANTKLVLLCFADFANDDGVCYPSIDRIAHKTGYGVRQVQRIIHSELTSTGLLAILEKGVGGRGNYPVYQVHPEKGVKMSPFNHKKGVKMSPFTQERVTSTTVKGDICDIERVTFEQKKDAGLFFGVESKSFEPSVNHNTHPSQNRTVEASYTNFGIFWDKYPKQEKKLRAQDAWSYIPESEYGAVIAGLGVWAVYWESECTPPRYIPSPYNFLRDRQWQDTPPKSTHGDPNGIQKFKADFARRHGTQ